MGERGLLVVQHQGRYRVAQYHQFLWITHTGIHLLGVLQRLAVDPGGLDRLRHGAERCTYIAPEQLRGAMIAVGGRECSDGAVGMTTEAMERFALEYPHVRASGRELLEEMLSERTGPIVLEDGLPFAGDGLWCELVLVVDLDAETYETFQCSGRGIAVDPQERFGLLVPEEPEDDYGPVRLISRHSLSALPTAEEWLKDATPIEERIVKAARSNDDPHLSLRLASALVGAAELRHILGGGLRPEDRSAIVDGLRDDEARQIRFLLDRRLGRSGA